MKETGERGADEEERRALPHGGPGRRDPAAKAPPSARRAVRLDPADPNAPLGARLQGLLLFRVIVVTLIFGGTLAITLSGKRDFASFTPSALAVFIGAAYGATALASVSLLRRGPTRANAWAQLVFDLVLTSGLVYLSGGAGSIFSVLFGVVVLEAAVTLGAGPARATAAVGLIAYLGIGYLLAAGHLPFPPDQDPRVYFLGAEELGFALLSNATALMLVAALSGYLATRLARAGGQLRLAEASAEALAQINADIVASLTAGVVSVDARGQITRANPAAEGMLGAHEASLRGRPLTAHLPLTLDPAGESRGEGEGRRADGSVFPFGYSTMPLRGQQGEALVLFQDLTEVRALRAQADRAERHAVLGRLASGLAHEIRNPLGSISGSVQLVRESRALDAEDQHLLGVVLDEVDRLNQLVSTMLDVGRSSAPQRTSTDLAQLARDLIAVARQDPTLSRVTFELDAPSSAEAHVDPGQVRQLVWNLLKNAAQASPPEARVSLRVVDGGEHVRVEVGDAGPGIPHDERGRLFEMFWSKRAHGIGIGLALVRQIVDAHGGTIEVDDSPLGGALFRVHLPVRASERATPPFPPDVRDEA
ncbi:MAG: PAS domain S-box protein [Myxococcales bacterium]|nr:PAS domain S-box protein [Myxococcales bacterium]